MRRPRFISIALSLSFAAFVVGTVAEGFWGGGDTFARDTRSSSDGSAWKLYLEGLSTTTSASGTLYAVCLA